MRLPHIMPGQIKKEPDQVTALLNRLIDTVNELQEKQ